MKLSGLTRPTGPKRPWLAGLLALLVTGLGHAYLRRWLRGFGWLAATYAVALLLVPPEAIEAVTSGDPAANPLDVAPPLLVIVASAVDAYVLARRTQTRAVAARSAAAGTTGGAPGVGDANGPDAGDAGGASAAAATADGEAQACPACGKDLDADLDFCPWCSTELDRPGPNGGDDDPSGR